VSGESVDVSIKITDHEFELIRKIMYERTGVFLRDTKKTLVVARLRKRLLHLGLTNFGQYIALLKSHDKKEVETFINAITTNETNFFRHPKQFEFLMSRILPDLRSTKTRTGQKSLRFWSAACATGEEPYTIAMLCREFFKDDPSWSISIYASDINSEVLAFAQQGVYTSRSLRELPDKYFKKYFQKQDIDTGHGKEERYKIADDIMRGVQFRQHNLLTPFIVDQVDVVFFRNAMIYFDDVSKREVLKRIYHNMASYGYVFISLAENLPYRDALFEFIGMGIYRRIG
jgi:chemotaxis protein methyltransferase CheR